MKALSTLSCCVGTSLLVLSACDKKGSVVHFKVDKSPLPPSEFNSPHGKMQREETPTTSPSPSTSKSPYAWSLPDGWSAKPPSGMRLATIVIPAPTTSTSQTPLEASMTELGGDLVGNINRWRGQVNLTPLSPEKVMTSLKSFASPLGREGKGYLSLIVNPQSPDKAILGAIIPRPSGRSIFIKIQGNAQDLQTIQPLVLSFSESLKKAQ